MSAGVSAGGAELSVYRRAEVSSRNGAGGAPVWLIYKDYVYDVTTYVNEHPGGTVLLEEAGRDASAAFDDVGHSADARRVLSKYRIGRLPDEEREYDERGRRLRGAGGGNWLSICSCGLLS